VVDRNTVVGIDLLVVGFIVAGLGYTLAQSVPIAALGFALAVIGALLVLLVPEPVPQDAYKALLSDSIRNVEIILEESDLHERAYFMQLEDGETRALIPLSALKAAGGASISSAALRELDKAPRRFIVDYHGLRGLMLIPPGAQIVKLAKVEKGGDLEESLRSVLVEFSDLASTVLAVEEEEGSEVVRVQIAKPKLLSESPFFNNCLGSPVSCIAACVATVVRGQPVRIMDEKYDPALVRLTLEMVE